jgi:hypothetical protein
MTALDQGAAQTAIPQQAPGSAPAVSAPAVSAPAVSAAVLPRDPQERLAALFDPGTLRILPVETEERGGVVAGAGLVHGASVVAFASDPRVQGGAMGTAGCAAIVAAFRSWAYGILAGPGWRRAWPACTRWARCSPR